MARTELVERFIDAMARLEADGDTEPLLQLYGDDAAAGNVLHPDNGRGREGIERFWTEYRAALESPRSTYRVVVGDDDGAALEWTTKAGGPQGPVTYTGVTVLEVGNGRITRSMAYYDPHHLGQQIVA